MYSHYRGYLTHYIYIYIYIYIYTYTHKSKPLKFKNYNILELKISCRHASIANIDSNLFRRLQISPLTFPLCTCSWQFIIRIKFCVLFLLSICTLFIIQLCSLIQYRYIWLLKNDTFTHFFVSHVCEFTIYCNQQVPWFNNYGGKALNL